MSAVIEPAAVAPRPQAPSLLAKIAARYSVDPSKMLSTLKQTAFKLREGEVSNEQMMALLIVADQYRLNPFTREIYAFPDKNNGVVPVVGVDGWARIINEHPQFDGVEFVDGPAGKDGLPEWIEAIIYRKDREHATRAREYMVECKRGTQPWQSHPRRMLRHKAMIQCARIAFSFVGIYDEDEAQRIAEAQVINAPSNDAVEALNAGIKQTIEHAPSPVIPQPASQPAPQPELASAAPAHPAVAPISAADDPAAGRDVAAKTADWCAAIEASNSTEDAAAIYARATAWAQQYGDEQIDGVLRLAHEKAVKRLQPTKAKKAPGLDFGAWPLPDGAR